MPSLQSRFTGCLLGQCLADALGAPVEGQSGVACMGYSEQSLRPWLDGASPDDVKFDGQYTDDSQLARELLASLVECNGWIPDNYSKRLQHLFKHNLVVGRGLACDAAVRRLIEDVSWDHAGEPPPSAGNGTAMRAAPAGLFFHRDIEKMLEVAHEQGYMTHHDRRCSAGSIAIAGGVALIVREEFDDAVSFTNRLADFITPLHDEFADYVRSIPGWLSLQPEEAVKTIARLGNTPGRPESWPGISPYVIPSVVWSLYAFLRHPDNYADAVIDAIVCGGDVDTTAAMTGALSGAQVGADALPSHLLTFLHDDRTWGERELVQLARDALAAASV